MTTWTPVTKQSENWTLISQETRVFDPYVFDRVVFDTGSTAGVWDANAQQAEVWTPA